MSLPVTAGEACLLHVPMELLDLLVVVCNSSDVCPGVGRCDTDPAALGAFLYIDCRLLMGLHGLLGVLHQNVITSNSRGGMLPGLKTTGRAGNYEVPLQRLPS
jgi:hypothetical protein